jgi:alcohol dehydrogenase class IV
MFTIYSPTRIVFGQAVRESLLAELEAAHVQRILLVSDPVLACLPWVHELRATLVGADRAVALFTDVSSSPTTREVSEGLGLAQDERVQAVVGVGGGSVIDAAKAIAMLLTNGGAYSDYLYRGRSIEQRGRFMIAVPTTAGSGSEVTSAAFIADPGHAGVRPVRSPLMFPHIALIDPEMTRSLPPSVTAATGIGALVQSLEAYVGRQANPYTDPLAVTGMQTVWSYLPRAFASGDDMTARQAMLLAALWGGMCRDQAGGGLVDALAGALTTHLQLHSGLANALLLPHVLGFNLPAIPPVRRQRLNRTFGLAPDAGADQLVERMTQFVHFLGLPTHLTGLQVAVNDYDWGAIAAEAAQAASASNNPRDVSVADCQTMLRDCCLSD